MTRWFPNIRINTQALRINTQARSDYQEFVRILTASIYITSLLTMVGLAQFSRNT